jgi:hypothetical protein
VKRGKKDIKCCQKKEEKDVFICYFIFSFLLKNSSKIIFTLSDGLNTDADQYFHRFD